MAWHYPQRDIMIINDTFISPNDFTNRNIIAVDPAITIASLWSENVAIGAAYEFETLHNWRCSRWYDGSCSFHVFLIELQHHSSYANAESSKNVRLHFYKIIYSSVLKEWRVHFWTWSTTLSCTPLLMIYSNNEAAAYIRRVYCCRTYALPTFVLKWI